LLIMALSTNEKIFLGTGAVVGSAAVLGGGYLVAKKLSKKRRKSKSVRKRNSKSRKAKRGRRTPRTAGKGKDRSRKRIRYTKNGQPYVLLKNGKARFIKRTSAKRSHRQKGGRY